MVEASDDEGEGAADAESGADEAEPEEETGKTLMGVGVRAVDAEEQGDESGDRGDEKTPLAQIEPKSRRAENNESEETFSGESDDEQADTAAEAKATPNRSFDALGDDDGDVHGRETSANQKPLSELADEATDEDESESRLSALRQRLQSARNDSETSDDNPFKDDGTIGEPTPVATEPPDLTDADDEGFADSGGADEIVDVSVAGQSGEYERSEGSNGTEEISRPPAGGEIAEGAFDWQEPDNEAESRDTKPSGQDQPPDELPEDLSEVSDEITIEETEGAINHLGGESTNAVSSPAPATVGDTSDDSAESPPPVESIPTHPDSAAELTTRDSGEGDAGSPESGGEFSATSDVDETAETSSGADGSSREDAGLEEDEFQEMEREMADEAADIVRELKDEGKLGADVIDRLAPKLQDGASDLIGKLRDQKFEQGDIDRLSRELGDEASDIIGDLRDAGELNVPDSGADDRSSDGLPVIPEPSEVSDPEEGDGGSSAEETLETESSVPKPVDMIGGGDEASGPAPANGGQSLEEAGGPAADGSSSGEWPEPVEQADVDFPDSDVDTDPPAAESSEPLPPESSSDEKTSS
ncbi:MAG: hypothetical protein ABEN55_05190, partial [Bradymonadaceae bacterium]